jgi:hypothetical protein
MQDRNAAICQLDQDVIVICAACYDQSIMLPQFVVRIDFNLESPLQRVCLMPVNGTPGFSEG